MSKEVEEAIKSCNLLLNGDIMLHTLDDDGGTAYSGVVNKLYNKDIETVLNYIKELEEKHKETCRLNVIFLKNINDRIPKQKIRELKEKIHNTLDKNGITRVYQLEIDNYFDELLEEE